MSETNLGDLGAMAGKIVGGGVSAAISYRVLMALAEKLKLNLQADQTNAALRDEMRKDLESARAIVQQMQTQIRDGMEREGRILARENAALARVAQLEAQVANLTAEVERLSGLASRAESKDAAMLEHLTAEVDRLSSLALRAGVPGIETTFEFEARTGREQADEPPEGGE